MSSLSGCCCRAGWSGRLSHHRRQTPVRGETLVDRLPTMMLTLMQKMAAPLPLASVICHLATMAVMMNMHIELSTLRHTPVGGPHRTLLDSDGDAVVTVAHMTKAIDHLQDTLGSRLAAVERENSELRERVQVMAYSLAEMDYNSRAGSDSGSLDEEQNAAKPRHRKQDAGDSGDVVTMPASCYDTSDVAMAALNASVALSQSHERLYVQLVDGLSTKANITAVDAQLSLKADVDAVVALQTQLEDKVNATTVTGLMVAKVNASTVHELSSTLADAVATLGDKADESSVVARLSDKADVDVVDTALAGKADEGSVAMRLAEKANATTTTRLSSRLVDIVAVLANKADVDAVVALQTQLEDKVN
eukprot:COSAG02_NODE_10849_length_1846_cov_1.688609_1_plen_362_part_10